MLIRVAYSLLLRWRPSALPPRPFFTASVLAGVALLAPLVAGGLGLAGLRRAPAAPVAAHPRTAASKPPSAARQPSQQLRDPAAERAP